MGADQFQFYAPLSFFEKASAPEKKRKRIGGVISTETLDKQGEVVIQKGLDFRPFLKGGWFNDNHKKGTADILGYPEKVQKFQKGDRLPDGQIASVNGTWAEGYLVDTQEAHRIWELGQALAKGGSDRRLGFSIEGAVTRRGGPGGKHVVKAVVRNVAITNCPVGEGTRLETFAKSLGEAMEHAEDEEFWKGLSMGAPTPGQAVAGTGPKTGAGAGQVLATQALEKKKRILEPKSKKKKDDEDMDKSMAVALIKSTLGCDDAFAEEAYGTLVTLEERGLL